MNLLSKKIYFSSICAIFLCLALLFQSSSFFQHLVFLDAIASQPGTFTSTASTVNSGQEFTVTLTGVNFAASGTPNSFTLFARTEFNTDVSGVSVAVDPSPVITGTSTGFLTTAVEEVAGFKLGKVRIANSADPDAFDVQAKFTVTNNEASVKRILVFGDQTTPGGQVNTGSPYYVSVNPAAPVCGDNNVDSPETCDDGNTTSGDGCSATCVLEVCGDGIVNDAPNETCDDSGNSATCDNDCSVAACGDGLLNSAAGEACDDGNTTSGDGCSSLCLSESSGGRRRRPDAPSVLQEDGTDPETLDESDTTHGSAVLCKDELLDKEEQKDLEDIAKSSVEDSQFQEGSLDDSFNFGEDDEEFEEIEFEATRSKRLSEVIDYFAETTEKDSEADHQPLFVLNNSVSIDSFTVDEDSESEDLSELVVFSGLEDKDSFSREIESYTQRFSKSTFSDELNDFLIPMWPAYNSATYGNILAYLSPGEKDPLAYAKEKGFIDRVVTKEEYISRRDFIDLLDRIFLKNNDDPVQVLYMAGVLTKLDTWYDQDWKAGFPLVEGVSVILDTVEIAFQSEKERYEENLIPLTDEGPLVFSEDVLELSIKAFDHNDLYGRLNKRLDAHFAASYGEVFDFGHIEEIKSVFEELSGYEPSAVYEPDAIQVVDDCTKDLAKKTSMPSVFKTGDLGFTFICDSIGISFPRNAWVMNFNGLPDVEVEKMDESRFNFKLEASLSYKNTLIIGESGEEPLSLMYSTPGNDLHIGKYFDYFLADVDAGILVDTVKSYEDLNGEVFGRIYAHLRQFSGNMFFSVNSLPIDYSF